MAFPTQKDQEMQLGIKEGRVLPNYELQQREHADFTNPRGEVTFQAASEPGKPWQAGMGKYAPTRSDR